jgi:hypothetical protein
MVEIRGKHYCIVGYSDFDNIFGKMLLFMDLLIRKRFLQILRKMHFNIYFELLFANIEFCVKTFEKRPLEIDPIGIKNR